MSAYKLISQKLWSESRGWKLVHYRNVQAVLWQPHRHPACNQDQTWCNRRCCSAPPRELPLSARVLPSWLHAEQVIGSSEFDHGVCWQVDVVSCEGTPMHAASAAPLGVVSSSRADNGMVAASSSGPSQMVIASGAPAMRALSTATSQLTAVPPVPTAHAAANEAEALAQEAAQLKAQAENFKVST